MASFFKLAFQKQTVKSAIRISLIVGVILNFINQGDAILSLDFEKLSLLKTLLTFAVPYIVSTYSSVLTKREIKL